MKIKFHQFNKQQKENHKSLKQLQKENNNSQLQLSNHKNKRKFGKDITKQQLNISYNFIVPKTANLYQLPPFFKKNVEVPKEMCFYEEDILKYLINTHDGYDLLQKTKKSFKKRAKRIKVVQFYIAICKKYKLREKTLFLATYYYDKYLELVGSLPVQKQTLSAEACLLIAMKYQEIYPPYLKDWCSNPNQVMKMEALVLKELDFKLAFTTARHYLEIYLSKMPNQSKQRIVLYECLLQFYLVTGKIYAEHPLKIVQQIIDAFRTTSLLQNQTEYSEFDRKLQIEFVQNKEIWQKILKLNISNQNY